MTVSNALSREKAVQSLQGQAVTLRYDGCTEFRYASAKYTFVFSEHEWRREMVHFYGAKDTGPIPADSSIEAVWVWAVSGLFCGPLPTALHGSQQGRQGRPPIEKPREFSKVYRLVQEGQITNQEAMHRLGLKSNTYYRFVHEEKEGSSP